MRVRCLVRSLIIGMNAGLMLKLRRPMPNSSTKARGAPAISPHSVTGVSAALQAAMTLVKHAQHRRAERLAQVADLGIVAVGRHQVLHQVVRADRDEVDFLQQRVDRNGRRRHFEHEADPHVAVRLALGVQLLLAPCAPSCARGESPPAW